MKAQKAQVYFAPFDRRSPQGRPITESRLARMKTLVDAVSLKGTVNSGDLTALKLHMGEAGNDTYLRPVMVRVVVDAIKEAGGNPFLCDTNTLYTGSRKNAVDHLLTAIRHGFGYEVTGAPTIIGDGLKSNDYREVAVDGDFFQSVKIASAVVEADAMVVLSHFKGHVAAGFGGALKNLAMGCAPAVGKKEQHAARLMVDHERCIGCGRCSRNCPTGAITLSQGQHPKASVDKEICIGCCECMTVCPTEAVSIDWTRDNMGDFNRRMIEYAAGAVAGRKRVVYINVLMDITPLCDCVGWSSASIVPDIGLLASTDPVALDAACYQLVTDAQGAAGGRAAQCGCGSDKFHAIHPTTEPKVQIEHAEKIGMGTSHYELIEI